MTEREPFTTERLFCPGPTPVPLAAKIAALDSTVYHRSEAFYKTFRKCRELLAPIMGAYDPPLLLTCSGTGAMEAAVVNLTDPDDEIVVVSGGKFGERWEKLGLAYGCKMRVLKVAWGQSPDLAAIVAELQACAAPKALFFQANETSTGVHYPVEAIMKAVRSVFDGLVVVDAISSLGAHSMRMDAWKIDCVVGGSQKGFGIPPGLAFIALSRKAWDSLSKRPRFYFDLKTERKGQAEGSTAWTPAISIVQSLEVALIAMHATGLARVLDHHQLCADAVRAAAEPLGLSLFPQRHFSNALTAFALPSGMAGEKLLDHLHKRFGATFAGGQDHLAGKILRFSHLGFVDRFDIISGLAAVEFGLLEFGHKITLGAGVTAAMEVFASP